MDLGLQLSLHAHHTGRELVLQVEKIGKLGNFVEDYRSYAGALTYECVDFRIPRPSAAT
jgi:hypothetical protein